MRNRPCRFGLLILALVSAAATGCSLPGAGPGGGDELALAVEAGDVARALAAVRDGAAGRMSEPKRSAVFAEVYDRAKSAYDDLETRSAEFRDLLEILWHLDGGDPRYLYLATVYAYMTGQHQEVVRLGPAALGTPMRVRVAYMLAESHRATGDLARARAYYEMVLAENLVGFEDVRARCRARLEEIP